MTIHSATIPSCKGTEWMMVMTGSWTYSHPSSWQTRLGFGCLATLLHLWAPHNYMTAICNLPYQLPYKVNGELEGKVASHGGGGVCQSSTLAHTHPAALILCCTGSLLTCTTLSKPPSHLLTYMAPSLIHTKEELGDGKISVLPWGKSWSRFPPASISIKKK